MRRQKGAVQARDTKEDAEISAWVPMYSRQVGIPPPCIAEVEKMGLDSVELVMETEEEFKILFAWDELEKVKTVGQMVDVVFSKLRQSGHDPCPSQHAFYVVRRKLMETLGAKREAVKPDTRFEDLIPRRGRKEAWRGIVRAVAAGEGDWASLEPHRWVSLTGWLVLPAAVTLAGIVSTTAELSLLLGIVTVIVAGPLTFAFRTEIPSEYARVRDLVKYAKTLDTRVWAREEVIETLRTIVSKQLGIKEELVTLEARFVEDLGMN